MNDMVAGVKCASSVCAAVSHAGNESAKILEIL